MNDDAGSWAIFGGRKQNGTLLNDAWLMYRNPDKDDREDYTAVQVAGGSASKPAARYRHAAVCPDTVDGTGALYVYGGRTASSTLGDVRRLSARVESGAIVWDWEQIPASGSPAGRQGHTALWDPENKKILVFGGADINDQPLSDTLYALTLGASPTWSRIAVDSSAGSPSRPSARHGHLMVYDPTPRKVDPHGAPDANHSHRFLVFGGEDTNGLKNDVWVLWIPNAGSGANYKWQRIDVDGTKPSGRYRLAGDYDPNDRLIIVGGDTNATTSQASDEVWALPLWELATGYPDAWEQLADHPQRAMTGHTMNTQHGKLKWARHQEIFDPSSGTWDAVAQKSQDWFPFHFVMPATNDSIKIFAAGPDTASYILHLSESPARWQKFPAVGTPGFRGGSAVMYRPGKILKVGSRDTDAQGSTAVTTAKTIDLTVAQPAWASTDAMGIGRVNHNMVILPDGKVFVTGGTNVVGNADNASPVFTPQIWNPDTGGWTPMSGTSALLADSTVRGYHSNAILLPDGRVLTHSGFTNDGAESQIGLDLRRATMYCPPYLFNADSTLKTRPRTSSPSAVYYGSEFTVCDLDAGGIAAVNLIRPAASTHAFNMDQRFVPLSFQSCPNSGVVTVTAPSDPTIAPPGDYLLFLISSSSSKAPSVGRWIRLGDEDPFWVGCPCEYGGGALFAGGSGEGGDEGEPENAFLVGGGERPYRLKNDPTKDDDYVLRIRQGEGGSTSIDAIGLESVEHGTNERAVASGDHYLIGTLRSPAEVHSDEEDVTHLASETEDEFVVAAPGDTLTVSFDSPAEESETAASSRTLYFEAKRASDDLYASESVPSISVLSLTAEDVWQEIASFEPRRDFDEIVVEGCGDQVRLVFDAATHVRKIAELNVTDADATATDLPDPTVEHSAIGTVSSAAADEDQSTIELDPGDDLTLTWSALENPEAGSRSLFVRAVQAGTALARTRPGVDLASVSSPVHSFDLKPSAPNPFRGTAMLGFSLAETGHARLRLYNVAGRLVRTLFNQQMPAGPNVAVWDGADQGGVVVGSGMYFARLEAGNKRMTRSLIFVGR
jgi:hypothetical protein